MTVAASFISMRTSNCGPGAVGGIGGARASTAPAATRRPAGQGGPRHAAAQQPCRAAALAALRATSGARPPHLLQAGLHRQHAADLHAADAHGRAHRDAAGHRELQDRLVALAAAPQLAAPRPRDQHERKAWAGRGGRGWVGPRGGGGGCCCCCCCPTLGMHACMQRCSRMHATNQPSPGPSHRCQRRQRGRRRPA